MKTKLLLTYLHCFLSENIKSLMSLKKFGPHLELATVVGMNATHADVIGGALEDVMALVAGGGGSL